MRASDERDEWPAALLPFVFLVLEELLYRSCDVLSHFRLCTCAASITQSDCVWITDAVSSQSLEAHDKDEPRSP